MSLLGKGWLFSKDSLLLKIKFQEACMAIETQTQQRPQVHEQMLLKQVTVRMSHLFRRSSVVVGIPSFQKVNCFEVEINGTGPVPKATSSVKNLVL